ncbi:hypothetical protein [Candidatus Protochlamydia amoebophila]|uniref:hypothetical protein n=1 Tax=Candidatus Protochlamydia amoebophila TaxID=362787 RepID=UPI001BC94871|nr:hypothetical protein [Candidatus Protochlamydia amoebophila]
MYSHLCWFVESQATHNPLVVGSNLLLAHFFNSFKINKFRSDILAIHTNHMALCQNFCQDSTPFAHFMHSLA